MFREVLTDLVGRLDGALGAVMMGSDGIMVEQVAAGGPGFDPEVVAMELSVVLREVVKTMKQIDAGPTEEVLIRSAGLTAIIRVLTEEYFVALALKPGANLGKGRFLLRGAGPRLIESL